jgi:endo-1,3(4)-beta-glucanase
VPVSVSVSVSRPRPRTGIVAVAPHQWIALDPAPAILGTFPTPRGPLRLVAASELRLSFPLRGLVPGVPATGIADDLLTEIIGPITAAEAGPLGAGSYFGSKHLARLATLVELARRVGAPRPDLEATLTDGVIDALTRSGDDDTRWMAYDTTWGGVILEPAEFGSQDYNDHHFHYGYLVHAAAVVAEIDPTFADEHAPLVDLLVSDVLGDEDDPGFPERRAFNPYLGHSFASGFAPFADGNNQESSSEAVNAWWALARWGLVTGRSDLIDDAVAHLHVEAQAARVYWLGELGDDRPAGYAHEVAGIVWGGKIDFATWFDGRASAVIGIQLLPVNFGSLHRADAAAAQRRFDASADDLLWPDVSLMDLALAAPVEALAGLTDDIGVDDGNTLAFARYWAASLAVLGPPRADVAVDAPYGAAFGEGDRIVVVGVNPTSSPVEVGFRVDGEEIARLTLAAHGSAMAEV